MHMEKYNNKYEAFSRGTPRQGAYCTNLQKRITEIW